MLVKQVGGTGRRCIGDVVVVAFGDSGGSGKVVLSCVLGGNVLGIMIGVALRLGIGGCGKGVNISGFLGLGYDVQDVPVLGVVGVLPIGGNDCFDVEGLVVSFPLVQFLQ